MSPTKSGVKEKVAAPVEPTTTEMAIASGRKLYESAAARAGASEREADLLAAVRMFQKAIEMDRDSIEGYPWLSQTLRTLAQSVRDRAAEIADYLLRCACAAAWESKERSTPSTLSQRTRQEVKILIAWLRATKHLSPPDAELELQSMREKHLREALDVDHVAKIFSEPIGRAAS
jgi:hypothetical protein